jgi:hypothetical protein
VQRTKQPRKRQIINMPVDPERWTELRKVALDQKRTAAEVLDDAIALYLKSVGVKR